mgnify:CR=1 FL=1
MFAPWVDQLLLQNSNAGVQIFPGKGLGDFTGSNKIDSAANQLMQFGPGKTLWLIFQSTAVNSVTTETILGCNSGSLGTGRGWTITRQATTNTLFLLSSGVSGFVGFYTPPVNGITVLALKWQASDNHVIYSVNGGPATDAGAVATPTALDSACKSYIGTDNGALGSVPLLSGRVAAFAIWSTEATTAQMQSNTCNQGNRLALSAAVRGDASCTVDFNAFRDWNGVAATFTTLGSAPVTFNVTGAVTLTDISELRIPTSSSMYFDSKTAIASTDGNGYRYTIRDSYARLRMVTDALYIGCETYSSIYNAFPTSATIGLYKNSAFVAEYAALQNAKPQIFDVQPGSGSGKTLDILEGARALSGGSSTVTGTVIKALYIPINKNTTISTPTPPQKRLVLLGDSILTGYWVSVFQQDNQAAKIRADFPTSGTGGVTSATCGTQSIKNIHDNETINAFAATIASMLDGTVSNTLWIQLGTNDYGFVTISTANFQTYYGQLVDAIQALVPNVQIICQSPIQRIAPASESANGLGYTLGDYRTAISNVVATRGTFCTYVEGAVGAIVPNANLYSDGLHIKTAGALDFKNFIKTTLSY